MPGAAPVAADPIAGATVGSIVIPKPQEPQDSDRKEEQHPTMTVARRRTPPVASPDSRRRDFAIVFAVMMAVAAGNSGLQSVLPAIGREIHIPDPLVAGIFSLSALLWTLSAPVWARASDRRGRKPLIALGLGGFVVIHGGLVVQPLPLLGGFVVCQPDPLSDGG